MTVGAAVVTATAEQVVGCPPSREGPEMEMRDAIVHQRATGRDWRESVDVGPVNDVAGDAGLHLLTTGSETAAVRPVAVVPGPTALPRSGQVWTIQSVLLDFDPVPFVAPVRQIILLPPIVAGQKYSSAAVVGAAARGLVGLPPGKAGSLVAVGLLGTAVVSAVLATKR